jgi:hypothetical protein
VVFKYRILHSTLTLVFKACFLLINPQRSPKPSCLIAYPVHLLRDRNSCDATKTLRLPVLQFLHCLLSAFANAVQPCTHTSSAMVPFSMPYPGKNTVVCSEMEHTSKIAHGKFYTMLNSK